MSRSKNVRSKYQSVPLYVERGLAERDASKNVRTRDSRGREKQELRATLRSIRKEA